jgi:hypothetical protein
MPYLTSVFLSTLHVTQGRMRDKDIPLHTRLVTYRRRNGE